jgi:Zn-dependent metalloprotease
MAYNNPIMGRDPQPDHMDNYFSGPADNQGVHINSGIFNKAFYLASSEIGTDKAGLIWYQALQNLWPTADFNHAFAAIENAAHTLVGDQKVPLDSVQAVRWAFKQVGIPF